MRPSKRRHDARVGQVDLRQRDGGGGLVTLRLPFVDIGLRGRVFLDHAQLPVVLGLRVQQLRLVAASFAW